jgi:hypothetical protein
MPILAYELTSAACTRWWRGFPASPAASAGIGGSLAIPRRQSEYNYDLGWTRPRSIARYDTTAMASISTRRRGPNSSTFTAARAGGASAKYSR